jgi:hypothetical protein
VSDPETRPPDSGARQPEDDSRTDGSPVDDSRVDDARLEDPTVDAPWKDLGPRDDLGEDEVAQRAARPDPHSGS